MPSSAQFCPICLANSKSLGQNSYMYLKPVSEIGPGKKYFPMFHFLFLIIEGLCHNMYYVVCIIKQKCTYFLI